MRSKLQNEKAASRAVGSPQLTSPVERPVPPKAAVAAPVDEAENAASTQVRAPVDHPDELRPSSANDARNKCRIDPLHISAGTDEGLGAESGRAQLNVVREIH